MNRPKILHVIGSLTVGGTEVALCKVLSHIKQRKAKHCVVSLLSEGPLRASIERLGIPVYSIGMNRRALNVQGVLRLVDVFRREQPDVAVTWMYHSNLLGGVAAKITRGIPVVWNIRNSGAEVVPYKLATRLVAQFTKLSSYFLAPHITFVSHASREAHARRGYCTKRSSVIPNGFDTAVYCPSNEARQQVRQELGVSADAKLVGMIARFHSDKDHANFVAAAGGVHAVDKHIHFVLCGKGASPDNKPLVEWINRASIGSVTHLLGRRSDVPRIAASLDLSVLSSSSEAFPNAVGEAMSCGIPCVVTDVGDSALIVGDTGRVVPARDSTKLASAIVELLSLPGPDLRKLGSAARSRIVDNFTIERIAPKYEELWLSMARVPRQNQVDMTEKKFAA